MGNKSKLYTKHFLRDGHNTPTITTARGGCSTKMIFTQCTGEYQNYYLNVYAKIPDFCHCSSVAMVLHKYSCKSPSRVSIISSAFSLLFILSILKNTRFTSVRLAQDRTLQALGIVTLEYTEHCIPTRH